MSPLGVLGQTTIGTGFTPSVDPGYDFWTGCFSGTCAYIGQTFTTPTALSRLTSFSFGFQLTPWQVAGNGFPTSDPRYDPYAPQITLMAWDGSNGTGPMLVQGQASSTISQYFAAADPTRPLYRFDWTFGGGGLALSPATHYLAFVTSSSKLSSIFDARPMGWATEQYLGGHGVVYQTNKSTYDALPAPPSWNPLGSSFRFEASFQPVAAVPEPGSVLLLLSGLLALGIVAYRRRQDGAAGRGSA